MKLTVQKGKNGNRLVFAGPDSKEYKAWNIGPATRVTVTDKGTLVGYKGKKKVWEADAISKVSRKALAASKRAKHGKSPAANTKKKATTRR